MAYPNLSGNKDDGTTTITIELENPASEERKQIGFEGFSEKTTTPTSDSEQLLTKDKTESRPRLNTAERVSTVQCNAWLSINVDNKYHWYCIQWLLTSGRV